MIKVEKINRLGVIAAGDIIVKYPLEGMPTNSFTGRNLNNSIAYEVSENNIEKQQITLILPDAPEEAGQDEMKKPIIKTYTQLAAEKVWWIANYQ